MPTKPTNNPSGKQSTRGGHLGPTKDAHKQHRPRSDEETLDEALEESFPASDPPARTEPTTSVGSKKDERGTQSTPTTTTAADRKLDEALAQTFPASDPPAQTQPIVHVGGKATNGRTGDAQRQR